MSHDELFPADYKVITTFQTFTNGFRLSYLVKEFMKYHCGLLAVFPFFVDLKKRINHLSWIKINCRFVGFFFFFGLRTLHVTDSPIYIRDHQMSVIIDIYER